ncbi:MAG: AAA family ATPase, partial [Desulfobacterales bacterium]|nr:AAA family ATPase [Desulfobacterales bacterium]
MSTDHLFINSVQLNNFLSFGPASKALELGPLNVLIGKNSCGKSNLIEAFAILRATPKNLLAPVRQGGGVREWLWKGADEPPTA